MHFTSLLMILSGIIAMATISSTRVETSYLITENNRRDNDVTLECRRVPEVVRPEVSVFFRNRKIFRDNIRGGLTTFHLTRELEGVFTCGERTADGALRGQIASEHQAILIRKLFSHF